MAGGVSFLGRPSAEPAKYSTGLEFLFPRPAQASRMWSGTVKIDR
jgi:hypothetical protein